METIDFLRSVLGDGYGHYCMFAANAETNKRVQKFYRSVDAVADAADSFDEDGYDVYFGLGTLTEAGNRKRDNVSHLQSFFLDLDCGPSKEYPSQVEAIRDLRKFCSKLNLPTPLMVNSGRGVHVYWTLSKPVLLAKWLTVAERLKKACVEQGLLADPAVTADAARILRVPNTHNYKDDPPLPVQVYGIVKPEPVVLEDFVSLLGGDIKAPPADIELGPDALYETLASNKESSFKSIIQKTMNGKGCAQLGYIMSRQDEVSEPLWRAGLSITKFCVDVDMASVKMSERHEGYDYQELQHKLKEIKGPYTCAKFDELNPDVCGSCSLRDQVKSPIVIGQRIKRSNGEVEVRAKVEAGGQTEKTFSIPAFPRPYFRGENGGIYLRTANSDGDEDERLVYQNDLYVTRRLRDAELGEVIVFRLHLPKDGVREFTVPLTSVTSRDEFRKNMSLHGVAVFGIKPLEALMTYTQRWIEELQATATADEAHRQFGWVDDDTMEEFVLGDKLIVGDDVRYNPPSAKTASLFDAFIEKGDRDTTIRNLAFYDRPDWELHQFIIGMGYGTILMPLTGIKSLGVHLVSETGFGKTTTSMAALSVWGQPDALILQANKQGTTLNAQMNRGELYHNLLLVADEITNLTSRDMSEYAYALSGGRQKNRLAQNGNTERVRGKPWQLLGLSSANVSAWDLLFRDKAEPKAEMQRMLELKVPKKLADPKLKRSSDELMKSIERNYGWLAIEYVQWVINNKDEVSRLLLETQNRLDQHAGLESANRFWSAGCAATLTGLMIAKKLGHINYDIKAVFKWLVTTLRERKAFVDDVGASVSETITNYIYENYNNLLWIESTEDLRGNNGNGLDQLVRPETLPRGKLVARYEPDTKKLFLLTKPLKEWCTDQQINYQSFTNQLKEQLGAKYTKQRITKGTKLQMPTVWTYELTFHLEERNENSED